MFEQFFVCEQHTLDKYIKARENADKISIQDAQVSFIEDLNRKADAMNNIYSVDADGNAKISIEGVLVNRDPDLFDALFDNKVVSYNAINRAIGQAVDTAAKKVTFFFNTPGGDVAGVEKTRGEIQALSDLIETEGIVGDMAASGGVWLASGIGKKLTPQNRLSAFGSIGVLTVAYDTKEMLSNFGVTEIVITNEQSPDKAPDASTVSGYKVIQERLNTIYGVFRDNVVEGFGVSPETVDNMRGRVVYADEACALGFFAGCGTRKKDEDKKNTSSAQAVENITQEGNMDLKEFLATNPDAKAEFDQALESAKASAIEATQANIAEILSLEGVKISASAAKAIDTGASAKDYAVEKLREQNEKREQAGEKKSPFSALTSAQEPSTQAPAVASGKEFDAKAFDEESSAMAKSMFGGIN